MDEAAEFADRLAIDTGRTGSDGRGAAYGDNIDPGGGGGGKLPGAQLASGDETDTPGPGQPRENSYPAPIQGSAEVSTALIESIDEKIREFELEGVFEYSLGFGRSGPLPIRVGHRHELRLTPTPPADQVARTVQHASPVLLPNTAEAELVERDTPLMIKLPIARALAQFPKGRAHRRLPAYRPNHLLANSNRRLAQRPLRRFLDIDDVSPTGERLNSFGARPYAHQQPGGISRERPGLSG